MSTPIQKSELRVVVRSAEYVDSARHRLAGANDIVVYAAASDPIALDAIDTLVKAAGTKSVRPLSGTLFKWVPGGWEIVRR